MSWPTDIFAQAALTNDPDVSIEGRRLKEWTLEQLKERLPVPQKFFMKVAIAKELHRRGLTPADVAAIESKGEPYGR
jgi:hypothetical protein